MYGVEFKDGSVFDNKYVDIYIEKEDGTIEKKGAVKPELVKERL